MFLCTITQNLNYTVRRAVEDNPAQDVAVEDFVKEVLGNHYADFLLNFQMEELIAALEE